MVKALFLDKLAQLLKVFLGFAWEADDEGGANDDVGNLTAELCEHLADHLAVAVAVHRGEHTVADVLEGQVDVGQDPRVVAHLCDQVVGDLVGVAVEQTDPRDRGLLGDLMQQLGEGVFAVEIEPVTRDVGGGDGTNDVLDALSRMRSALGLETPEPTRRDRRAIRSLLERIRKHDAGGGQAFAEDEMLRVVAWMPSNTFWLRRVMTGRALAENWPDIVNDYAVDLIDKQRAYEAQTVERDKPQAERRPHQHTWLCSHVLAELGCTREQVQTDERLQGQAWRVAVRMNEGAGKRASVATGIDAAREGGA